MDDLLIKCVIMNPQELYNQAIFAREKIDKLDFVGALGIVNNLKESNSSYGAFLACGILIDIGNIQRNVDLVIEGTNILEKVFDDVKKDYPSIGATAHYNLANGYSSLFKFKKPNFSHYTDSELHKAKFHYRKALENEINTNLKVQIFTNIANCFDNIGRVLDGLEFYEKALELNPNHSMALGNKGIALKYYANIMGKHPDAFLIEAYSLLSKSLELGVLVEAEQSFKNALKNIEDKFQDKNKLKSPPIYPGCKIPNDSDFEEYYNKFCFNEKIYLNICNYCQKCDAAIGDSLLIRYMSVPISDKPLDPDHDQFLRLSSYLNQIKQDYVAAKFLFVLSQYKGIDMNFVDKNVRIIDTYDYQQNNIYIQLVKLSFKNLYDVLDKIAFFINDYFELGDDPDFVSFGRIWYSRKKNLRQEIINSKNPGLRALFDIHKDLDKGGYYYPLKRMRNALTHRFINIKMICSEEDEENIKEETLYKRTLELAKLVRNAVIYLIYCVQVEENIKKQNTASLPSLTATEIPDNLKTNRYEFSPK